MLVGLVLVISLLVPATAGAATPNTHVVKRGENLTVIARQYGIDDPYAICDLNGLTNCNLIHIGQVLLLPVTGRTSLTATAQTGCRSETWFNEALAATNDIAALIAVLDRDFRLDEGGQWSQPGYNVPAGSVFWTDLFGNRWSLPAGVTAVRTQGGWGVYKSSVSYTMPAPNGGGRWMRICSPTVTCGIPDLSGLNTTTAINAMDQWFEKEGYKRGGTFNSGDTLSRNTVFWTNLGDGPLPASVARLNTEGNWGIFQVTTTYTATTAGRYVRCDP